ncbi:hypothetical protein DVH24_034989 [Malus domestica]|uniref:Dehydrogenase E1 component domain-containing protein n=1 Tax=Malus domestica TaxID=3750 RepID=A0A498ID03_MALDO|nr:hypothetical protein DVH24_034989 [Malus domestica]
MERKDGCSKGKCGSMHFYKKDAGFYGGHGIVGAQIPLGCGFAFGQKYSKDETVTFAFYGEAKSPAYYKRSDYALGLKVDGMDVFAVKQACKSAKEHALKNGLIILEMDTYRYHGHFMSDPGSTDHTRDEISGIRQPPTISCMQVELQPTMQQKKKKGGKEYRKKKDETFIMKGSDYQVCHTQSSIRIHGKQP